MTSINRIHDEYLDPDRHLWPDEEPEDSGDMLKALAEWHCIDEQDPEKIKRGVERNVYKYTSCGCSIGIHEGHLSVSGYCEGFDGELPGHTLTWPFTEKEYWAALGAADNDGHETWNATHGCDACREHWKSEGCEPLDHGSTPVWSECPECQGGGEII